MRYLVPTTKSPLSRDFFFKDFDSIFDNFFETPNQSLFNLQCDVQESEKYHLLTFDLPGLEEKDINLEVKDGYLTISGERREEVDDNLKNHFRGRSYGRFQKTFTLPDQVDSEHIEADYTNGVLKVLLPKKEESKAKKIEVQSKKGNLLGQIFKKEDKTA